ncbi:hypothetical protein E2493_00160 [Sphingomonas parva]|uniref:SPOR domain-containing protein n=1 Tax=Sphingomonas parva TaxID=2555898 RepID=A0A4Y8ZXC5_9SPHN|nr:hypothetical protein [Sphingomonas parva]TFI60167.1 hypothetical protein E2493_00160 [Sphingomonas parva]
MRTATIILAWWLVTTSAASAAQSSAPAMPSCAGWPSWNSPPGRQWRQANRWRYHSDEEAQIAFQRLTSDSPSPWPDWFVPTQQELPVGTRFKMVLGAYQPPTRPGGFGTFDDILHVEDLRLGLAVKEKWKPLVDRVVTYEVTRPLPVHVGPIGPQLDAQACRLLPGRLSQLEMLVPPDQRMAHLRIVSITLFQPVEKAASTAPPLR